MLAAPRNALRESNAARVILTHMAETFNARRIDSGARCGVSGPASTRYGETACTPAIGFPPACCNSSDNAASCFTKAL